MQAKLIQLCLFSEPTFIVKEKDYKCVSEQIYRSTDGNDFSCFVSTEVSTNLVKKRILTMAIKECSTRLAKLTEALMSVEELLNGD